MHLFAGGGGGLLADLILGHTPIVAVEWDKYACEILRARTDDGWFEGLHVWEGDVRLFDPSEYEGRVDCIHAGFPCQDISQAGKQAGLGEGTRSGLYREVLRIAGVVRPKFLFMENVSAILSNGLGTVLEDLAEMGYDSRWCCIRASDVGAPHQRDRWWLKAEWRGLSPHTEHNRDGWGKQRSQSVEEKTAVMAKQKQASEFAGPGKQHAELADAKGTRFETLNKQASNSKRQSLDEQPRRDSIFNTTDGWWEVESDVGRVANGVADWSHRLKALGNGQVPLQAALAWRLLS